MASNTPEVKEELKAQNNSEPEVKEEVREVLVKTVRSTATKPTTFKQRKEIEDKVEMIKVGRDDAGKWLWVRSDRLTPEHKKSRATMLERIRKGLRI